MDDEFYNKLLSDLLELKNGIDETKNKKLDLELLERIIKRLHSFECEECKKYLKVINGQISILKQKHNAIDEKDIKEYNEVKNKIISHLQKEHKLVTKDYYIGIYMSLGITFGLIFGLSVFDNIALGLPIGLSIGLAIGTAKDEEAKKKGLVI